jgi:hypothetical protein
MPGRKFTWESLSDEQLLNRRLSSLRVTVEGTWLEDCLGSLHEELAERGIRLKPHAWISSEWFSPENTPGIAIPFYLAHPRLMKLEKKMILDVEGGTWSECMAILRHEAGHTIQHAYQLHRRRRWQQLFGPSSRRYPRYYRPNPASRHFVQHLRLWYAQSHPDEDFAETFAVWLRPRSSWRTRYAGWPALKKLEYVDELMDEIAGKRPLLTARERVDPLVTQRDFGPLQKSRRSTPCHPRLTTVISTGCFPPIRGMPGATGFGLSGATAPVRKLLQMDCENQLTLDAVLDDMITRCREHNLRAVGSERKLFMDFTVLLTAKTMHALFGPLRRKWIAL